jgi:acetyl esterase
MKLGRLARLRVALARPLARRLFASPALVRRLARARAEALGRGLDPAIAAVLGLDDLTHDSAIAGGSAERARELVAASIAIAEDAPAGAIDVHERSIPGPGVPLRARFYTPRGLAAPSPGLVFLHGGGWVTGDLDTHDALCRRLARLGEIRVVAIDYRLAPEHPFPAAVDDAVAAFRWVASEAEALAIDPARLGVGGDSAGGNLSALVSLETRSDARRPALAVLFYPAVDLTCAAASHRELREGFYLSGEAIAWYLERYLGADPARRRDPRASPAFVADLRGTPPTLVVHAAFDPLRDEAIAHAARLREAGVTVREVAATDMIHGFLLMSGISPAARALTEALAVDIGRALREGGA